MKPEYELYAKADAVDRRLRQHMQTIAAERKALRAVPESLTVELTPDVRGALTYGLAVWRSMGVAMSRADFIRMAITAKARSIAELQINNAGHFIDRTTNNTNTKDTK
jgi:hypothetical protein